MTKNILIAAWLVFCATVGIAGSKALDAFENSRDRAYVSSHQCRMTGGAAASSVLAFGIVRAVPAESYCSCENPEVFVVVTQ